MSWNPAAAFSAAGLVPIPYGPPPYSILDQEMRNNLKTIQQLLQYLFYTYIYYGDETKTLSTLLEQIYEITFLILENEE